MDPDLLFSSLDPAHDLQTIGSSETAKKKKKEKKEISICLLWSKVIKHLFSKGSIFQISSIDTTKILYLPHNIMESSPSDTTLIVHGG